MQTDLPTQSAPVILLHSGQPTVSDLNAIKIAKFMGAKASSLPLSRGMRPVNGCVIASAPTLAAGDSLEWLRGANVFVYGFEPMSGHGLLLEKLTSGEVHGVLAHVDGQSFSVAKNSRRTCGQFAGLSFGVPNPGIDHVFESACAESPSSLIRIGDKPFVMMYENGAGRCMLSACRAIADLDGRVGAQTSILEFFSSLMPLMMFLRAGLGDQVWHNDSPTACLIIDDPLLKPRYGFLDFEKFVQVMDRQRFSASLAFIPWNFRRTDRKVAGIFAAQPQRLSVCVHGCDHTGGEFGASDYRLLMDKCRLALDRMAQHKRLWGLDFDPVMVFPQGIFSTAAVKALRNSGYLAAVNSTPYPIDAPTSLTLRDLLGIATNHFFDFPIFTRRHPEATAELAFDLFVGKPALMVEHHGFFRDGYQSLAAAVERINALDERLHWTNLATICSGAYLKRLDNGDVHVQFITDRFRLKNHSRQTQNYVLSRAPGEEGARAVFSIDGRRVECGERSAIGPGQTADVRLERENLETIEHGAPPRPIYRVRVFVRRSLCEFRDNYVDQSPFLSRSVAKARELLFGARATSE